MILTDQIIENAKTKFMFIDKHGFEAASKKYKVKEALIRHWYQRYKNDHLQAPIVPAMETKQRKPFSTNEWDYGTMIDWGLRYKKSVVALEDSRVFITSNHIILQSKINQQQWT